MRARALIGLALVVAAGCGGGDAAPGAARGEVVREEIMGYELRLPAGWRALGRKDDNSPFEFGGDGKGCRLSGAAPGPPADDPEALLAEAKRNYERYAEKPAGTRAGFSLLEVPEPAIAVESDLIGPGEKRYLYARIVSASAAIIIECTFEEPRERALRKDLEAIYETVRMRTSATAERLQPQVAVLPTVAAAFVHDDEPGQLSATLDVGDLGKAEDAALQAARLLHEAEPSLRIAVVAENPDDRGPVIQAQIERGARKILLNTPKGVRRVPIDG